MAATATTAQAQAYAPFIKVTSWGTGEQSDMRHLLYLLKPGSTCTDASGNRLSKEQAIEALREMEALVVDPTHSSCRRVYSLMAETPEDRDMVMMCNQQQLAQRHGAFLLVRHPPDKTHSHDHIHELCLRDTKTHPMRVARRETYELKTSLAERYREAGIKFAPERPALKPAITNTENALKKKGRDTWKEPFRNAIRQALATAQDYEGFVAGLNRQGYTISRETTAGVITLSDGHNRLCRIGSLFSYLKTRQAVEEELTTRNMKRRAKTMAQEELKAAHEQKQKVTEMSNAAMNAGSHILQGSVGVVQAGASENPVAVAAAVGGAGIQVLMSLLPMLMRIAREQRQIDLDTHFTTEQKTSAKMYLACKATYGDKHGPDVFKAIAASMEALAVISRVEELDLKAFTATMRHDAGLSAPGTPELNNSDTLEALKTLRTPDIGGTVAPEKAKVADSVELSKRIEKHNASLLEGFCGAAAKRRADKKAATMPNGSETGVDRNNTGPER